MAQMHITEAELQRDLHAVLERVRQGIDVVVDDTQPAVVMKQATARRTIADVLALIPKDSPARMDAGFARDIEAGVEAHREPLDTSAWE